MRQRKTRSKGRILPARHRRKLSDKTSEIKFSADRPFPVLWAQQSDLLTSSEMLRITPRAKNIFGNMFGKENSGKVKYSRSVLV